MAQENGQYTDSASSSAKANSGSGNAGSANSDLTFQDKHDFIQGEIYAKRDWLAKFATGKSRWPDHIIDQKQEALRKLEDIADDYRKAAERQSV